MMLFSFDVQHEIFRLRADAELCAPNAETRTDVIVGMSFAQWSESVLIDSVGDPADGPYLSVVSMSGKLKVNAILLSLFQVIGLMVEFQHKTTLVIALQDVAERLAL